MYNVVEMNIAKQTTLRVCAQARFLTGVVEVLTGVSNKELCITPNQVEVYLHDYIWAPDNNERFEIRKHAEHIGWAWYETNGSVIASGRADTTKGAHELVEMYELYLQG